MSVNLKKVRIALTLALLFIATAISAQTISGTVVDQSGESIIGASVKEKGAAQGAVTDLDGKFTLKLTSKSNQVVVSYIGMKQKTVNVSGKSTVNITLEEESTSLNDVVVIGYGTMKKKDLTGSVASVSEIGRAHV